MFVLIAQASSEKNEKLFSPKFYGNKTSFVFYKKSGNKKEKKGEKITKSKNEYKKKFLDQFFTLFSIFYEVFFINSLFK